MMRPIRPLLWIPIALLPGCYSYRPATIDALQPGAEIRTRLSLAEAERIQEVIETEGRVIEGKVVDDDADALLLQVPVARGQVAGRPETFFQRVRIPRGEVVEVELKSLDRRRTGVILGAGLVVAGFVVAEQFQKGSTTGAPPPSGGGPAEFRSPVGIPLFRIPIGGH